MSHSRLAQLGQLARLNGVLTSYRDAFNRRKQASPEALLATLRALEAPIEKIGDAPQALRALRQANWQRILDPVIVAWNGGRTTFPLRIPSSREKESIDWCFRFENGETRQQVVRLSDLPTADRATISGVRFMSKRMTLAGGMPWGYHSIRATLRGRTHEALVIAAPRRAYSILEETGRATWGIFLPLYALSSQRSWGSGDFTDLDALVEWVTRLGGGVVATLPLLAAFLDECFEASPYSPISRLFWNEFYVDVTDIPEFRRSEKTRSLVEGDTFGTELGALRASDLVDYRRGMACKRKVLERLAKEFSSERIPDRFHAFRSFVKTHRSVRDYARFRAVSERLKTPWHRWPRRLRDGDIRAGDCDERVSGYHEYVQWVASEQLQAIATKARRSGPGLCLDFPLGVHPNGYDVWREREAFAVDTEVGAPPDPVFTSGQNWCFPPFHPGRLREQGYRYYIASLRHHLQHAGLLRIDHIMSLHRLFWIPKGFDATKGVYVRYPADELYAILSLESHRTKSMVVGENLGTVPPEVGPAMRKHGIRRMFVVHYEQAANPRKMLRAIPADTVACLNTHDMPPFAAAWKGLDVDDRVRFGLLAPSEAQSELKRRRSIQKKLLAELRRGGWLGENSAETEEVLRACLAWLSTSRSQIVLMNLEDLWGETAPQNIPGTTNDRPNWCRKARYPLEVFSTLPAVIESLKQVDRLRNAGDE